MLQAEYIERAFLFPWGGLKHTDRALARKESKTASRFNEEGGGGAAGVFIVVGSTLKILSDS